MQSFHTPYNQFPYYSHPTLVYYICQSKCVSTYTLWPTKVHILYSLIFLMYTSIVGFYLGDWITFTHVGYLIYLYFGWVHSWDIPCFWLLWQFWGIISAMFFVKCPSIRACLEFFSRLVSIYIFWRGSSQRQHGIPVTYGWYILSTGLISLDVYLHHLMEVVFIILHWELPSPRFPTCTLWKFLCTDHT